MYIRKALLTVVGIFMMGLSLGFAHAIWIETPSVGRQGETQAIKIYFGEFGTEDVSKASDWFADLSRFELQLIHPGGSKTTLPFTANGDHFAASFTPESEGLYNVVLRKVAGEVYYGYKLDYMATAHVQVGEDRKFGQQALPIALRPVAGGYQAGQAIDLSVLIDSTLTGEKEITVISPSTWTKRLYPDDKSNARFVPVWPGKYLVETTVSDKNKGEWNGKPYDVNYRCHTYLLEVK